MSSHWLEDDIAAALRGEADDVAVDTDRALAGLHDRVVAARRRRGAAVLLAVIVALGLAFAVRPGGEDTSVPPADPSDRVAVVEPRGAETFALGAGPQRLSLQGRTLWIALDTGSLGRVDTTTGTVSRVGELPSAPFDVEPVGELVWVSLPNAAEIVAVDQRDGRLVHSVPTRAPGPRGMTIVGGSLWATAGTDLIELDAATGQRLRTVPLPGTSLAYDVAVSGDAVWVTDSRGDAVTRVPLGGAGEPRRVTVGGPTVGVAAYDGIVWLGLKEEGRLIRLDEATGRISRGPRLAAAPLALVVIKRELWVTSPDADQVSGFDARSGRPRHRWHVGEFPPVVAGDGKRIWVSSFGGRAVVQVPLDQPDTNAKK